MGADENGPKKVKTVPLARKVMDKYILKFTECGDHRLSKKGKAINK